MLKKQIFILLFLIQIINTQFNFDWDLSNESIFEYKRYSTKSTKTNWVPYKASFYSREETKDNMPASELRGSTLKEVIKGFGRLQVSVDNLDIPLYTRFNIKLWDGKTIVPAMALDIGPGPKYLDIYVNNISEAINYGIKNVQVQFIN